MLHSTGQPTPTSSTAAPLVTTVLALVGLLAILSFTSKLEDYAFFGFLVPYENAISVVVVAFLGHVAVQSGTKWVYTISLRRTSEDVAPNTTGNSTPVGIRADFLIPGFCGY